MKLPEEFMDRMQKRLGEQYPAFLRSYDVPPYKGLRVNPLKISRNEFLKISPFPLEPIPWEENGFYVKEEKAGADLLHFAGLYYCQEPSAMCAAPLLNVQKGERVLDLCAAPGGKSTQLAARMQGEGALLCNEYVTSRANVLLSNLERLGVKNAAVVNTDAGRLAKEFPAYFDKILVDAPCSGEGMFKKEPFAVEEWSVDNVRRCALRQRDILENAAAMLSVGGRIVYSTCTFSKEENEEQIAGFLARHPEFTLLEQKLLLPHEIRGEGHFAALLEKREGERKEVKPFPVRHDKRAEAAYAEFAKSCFTNGIGFAGDITTLSSGKLLMLPGGFPSLNVFTLRAGVELGEWDGKNFKPSHALAMALKSKETARYVALNREEAERYLKGETLSVAEENGWCVVGIGEYPLGWGKAVNGTLKNHYPKGLRKIK